MMWHGDGWGWVAWTLMSVGMVAFWALVITAIVLAIRYLVGSRGSATPPPISGQARAEEILAEHFARGELEENEYRQRLALLREQRR